MLIYHRLLHIEADSSQIASTEANLSPIAAPDSNSSQIDAMDANLSQIAEVVGSSITHCCSWC